MCGAHSSEVTLPLRKGPFLFFKILKEEQGTTGTTGIKGPGIRAIPKLLQATIVDGVPHIVYPGLCLHDEWRADARARYCTNFVAAVPTDHANDVLLANWSKPGYNPIINGSARLAQGTVCPGTRPVQHAPFTP